MPNAIACFFWFVPLIPLACSRAGAEPASLPAESSDLDSVVEVPRDVILEACLQSLRDIRDNAEELFRMHPATLGHLGSGVVDEGTLSLNFSVTDERMKFRESGGRRMARPVPLKAGVQFQFVCQAHNQLGTPEGSGWANRKSFYWPFIDVRFEWSWGWPNGTFDGDQEAEFNDLLKLALRPLIAMEGVASSGVLCERNRESFVLHGRPGFAIELEPAGQSPFDGSHVVTLVAVNRSENPLAVESSPHNPTPVVILDGATDVDRLLEQIGRPQFNFFDFRRGKSDPFIYLQPNERRQLSTIGLGHLEPGNHHARVAVHYFSTGWTDMRPTYCDGAPEFRRVAAAWVGVVVSDEVTITVPSGPMKPTAP